MGFKEVASLDAELTTALGGVNKKTGKANPTQIEGYYLGSKTVESKMSKTGTAKIHVLQTTQGNVGVWGKTDLDRKIAAVTAGTMIRVTQSGKTKIPGRNDMYKFKVEVDEEDTIEVSTAPASDAQTDDSALSSESYEDSGSDDGYVDSSDEESALDEVAPTRPSAPLRAAQSPSAASAKKVQDLLKNRSKTA